jgi:hypothetical protein
MGKMIIKDDVLIEYHGDASMVMIPPIVTRIGKRAFEMCCFMNSVIIPDTVTLIGEEAFAGCVSLHSVTIPDSVTTIEAYAFDGCTSLDYINIPDSVISIDEKTFFNTRILFFNGKTYPSKEHLIKELYELLYNFRKKMKTHVMTCNDVHVLMNAAVVIYNEGNDDDREKIPALIDLIDKEYCQS